MFERLLVAVDGSEHSERAIPVAAEIAKKLGSEVAVFHIREVELGKLGPGSVEPSDDAKKLVDGVVEQLQSQGVNATGNVRSDMYGRAARNIIDAARELGVGMIIMGSRGFSDLPGLLLGSVAHKVIHHAECPVLVVR